MVKAGGFFSRVLTPINVRLLRRRAERGEVEAMTALGLYYSDQKEYPMAFRWWREAAGKGFAGAQMMLGVAYDYGNGVDTDKAEAAGWYRLAAEQGEITAALGLATNYMLGEGVAKDIPEALRWYKIAALRGDTASQILLGGIYAGSEFVTPDQSEAVRWYSTAFEASTLSASLAQKYERELRWFLWAAVSGDANVLLNVANIYSSIGGGISQDNVEALRWYKMAADKGSEDALCFLGHIYQDGVGAKQDFAKAMHYYRLAADRGNAGAMFNIAMLYTRSQGVVLDAQELYFWFRLCAIRSLPDHQRNHAYQALDILKQKLLPETIGDVEARVIAWKNTHSEPHYNGTARLTAC